MFFPLLIILSLIVLLFFYWGFPLPGKNRRDPSKMDYSHIPDKMQPVYKNGNKKLAVLLIHGFEGSPFEMKELGEYLYNLGYSVSIPLLPGHGTSINDLTKTGFKDWYIHVEEEYLNLKKNHKKVYIIGISLGGLLSLKIAENHEPDGIITISAPIFFNGIFNKKIVITNIGLFFSGFLSLFIKKLPISRKKNQEMNPWEGYENHIAINSAHTIKKNILKVRRNLYHINSPICLIHSKNDQTIPIDNIYYIFQNVNASEKRAFSFKIPNELTSNHVLTTHSIVKDRVFTYILEFINDCENNFLSHPKKLLGIKGFLKHSFRNLAKKIHFIRN